MIHSLHLLWAETHPHYERSIKNWWCPSCGSRFKEQDYQIPCTLTFLLGNGTIAKKKGNGSPAKSLRFILWRLNILSKCNGNQTFFEIPYHWIKSLYWNITISRCLGILMSDWMAIWQIWTTNTGQDSSETLNGFCLIYRYLDHFPIFPGIFAFIELISTNASL